MIQIIGFLICACLAVKLLEIAGNPALRTEAGNAPISAALWLGWAAVFGFTFWLLVQGNAFPANTDTDQADVPELTDAQVACITNAKTDDEILACTP